MDRATPAMQQYLDIKNKYPDCIVLFRMGDFYETFYEDAKVASSALDIVLTKRGIRNGVPIPLAGIPYHALDNYLGRLVKKGFKVALVEQMEDPRYAKGVVKRDVSRIITPGTVTMPSLLNAKSNNYLAAIASGVIYGLSYIDLSTGEFFTTETTDPIVGIEKISPAEIVVPNSLESSDLVRLLTKAGYCVHIYEERHFQPHQAEKMLTEHLKTKNLDGFGLAAKDAAVASAGALFTYVRETQRNALSHISSLKYYEENEFLIVDALTQRNLELVRNLKNSTENTLYDVLDHTNTAMGARLLRKWLLAPLKDIKSINERLDAVEAFSRDRTMQKELAITLAKIHDIERLAARITLGTASPRECIALKESLRGVPALRTQLSTFGPLRVLDLQALPDGASIAGLIERALVEDPPTLIRVGGLIRSNFSSELDAYRDIMHDSRSYIRNIEEKERASTGIKNLKVGYNRVFGYYIEINQKNLANIPAHFQRKQTTATGERFVTEELKILEEKLLGAEEKAQELEEQLYRMLLADISADLGTLQLVAKTIALIDCVNSLAIAATLNGYVRPELTENYGIILSESRHPVLERIEDHFIPNNIRITADNRLMIITGPNMAGKSTLMRQVALAVFMAQMGSFVPAKEATISIVDRIFTRVGAHDDLSHGQSTFMVEMNEVAHILNAATDRSLVIMDEIGRGTSTFDGVAIAWAVAEHLLATIRCKTLFATHYHVLSDLGTEPGANNYHIAVREDRDDIIFLRKLVEGGTDKSYGVHVARLAGMPRDVIMRARALQERLSHEDTMTKRIEDLSMREPRQKTLTERF
jgi:DNA mismatch repair protein MutS